MVALLVCGDPHHKGCQVLQAIVNTPVILCISDFWILGQFAMQGIAAPVV